MYLTALSRYRTKEQGENNRLAAGRTIYTNAPTSSSTSDYASVRLLWSRDERRGVCVMVTAAATPSSLFPNPLQARFPALPLRGVFVIHLSYRQGGRDRAQVPTGDVCMVWPYGRKMP